MKMLKFFTQLLLFLLIPGMIFTVIASKTPMFAGIQSFVVLTGSMEPTLPVGSLIYTMKSSSYKTGDVISFNIANNEVVTHRIVNVIGETYATKGDANNTNDAALIKRDKILGKTIFMIPFIGYLINFLKTPLGFSSLVIFPLTVFLVFEIWNFKIEIEKHIEKKLLDRMKIQQ